MITDESYRAFLPPFLQEVGYGSESSLKELGLRALKFHKGSVDGMHRWALWRGILEYAACVEVARHSLRALPQGNAIGSAHLTASRYHAAALVFFAQATMDQTAVWLERELDLKISGRKCQLHKNEFLNALKGEADGRLAEPIERSREFLKELERFRQTWIHSLAGGAFGFSDKAPDKGGDRFLAVPIDPGINMFKHDDQYYEQVKECRRKNNGEWLYPIVKFADRFADGTKNLIIEILAAVLICMI